MPDLYSELRAKIQGIAGGMPSIIFSAQVTEVQKETCSILVGGLTLTDVRLTSVVNDNANNLLLKPKANSDVLVADLSNGQLRDLVVIKYSEIDTITINGGELGGLIKICEFTKKLNDLVDAFNKHTHDGSFSGTINDAPASGTVSLTTLSSQQADSFKISDYEDDKIRH